MFGTSNAPIVGRVRSQYAPRLPTAPRQTRPAPTRIFDSFFAIKDVDSIVHPMNGLRPPYYGLFEDNDPSKRLMASRTSTTTFPRYWEWSGEGVYPFDTSNEAYKLGANYLIDGLTR